MKWEKRGLIYAPDGNSVWAKHSALTPTPILLNDSVIRVYAGFRDGNGVSRIGYVDVEAENPSRVLDVSKTPALDVGCPGTFDDNGVILGDVVAHESKLFLYYVAFQHVEKVKFYAFSGMAVSSDGGKTFVRNSQAPVLDRINNELFIRAIHSVMIENGVWKIWYASGNSWASINGNSYPCYQIRYIESPDGRNLHQSSVPCVNVQGSEYRIGRPRVYKFRDKYMMFYTRGTLEGDYIAGYAESDDGMKWARRDDDLGIGLSSTGWDSLSLCYPTLLKYRERVYMFYNGNNMGQTGFGYAVLAEW